MRRNPLVGIGVLTLSLILLPALPAQDDGFGPPAPPVTKGPKLVLPETEFDWGQIYHGEIIEHTFRVLNEGDDVLRISQVKPG